MIAKVDRADRPERKRLAEGRPFISIDSLQDKVHSRYRPLKRSSHNCIDLSFQVSRIHCGDVVNCHSYQNPRASCSFLDAHSNVSRYAEFALNGCFGEVPICAQIDDFVADRTCRRNAYRNGD